MSEKLEPDRCGYGAFSTGEDDPFFQQCVAHDRAYVTQTRPKAEVDQYFADGVRREARERGGMLLRLRAEAYAIIARVGGWFVW